MARMLNRRRAVLLAAVIVLQSLTAMFFVADVVADLAHDGALEDLHMGLEALASIALVGGILFLMIELRRVLSRMSMLETATQAARGEMAEVIDGFFADWGLTPSERDVALLMLKGIENDEIARLRGTASGTVRAQCAAIFRKAGVEGRPQLFSVFMEELLAGDGAPLK
jgi:DNA-binding CsgD family transcriptional regulator